MKPSSSKRLSAAALLLHAVLWWSATVVEAGFCNTLKYCSEISSSSECGSARGCVSARCDSYGGNTFCSRGCQTGRAGRGCSDVTTASICDNYSNCEWSGGGSGTRGGSDSSDPATDIGAAILGFATVAGAVAAVCYCRRKMSRGQKNGTDPLEARAGDAKSERQPEESGVPISQQAASMVRTETVTEHDDGSKEVREEATRADGSISVTVTTYPPGYNDGQECSAA